MAKRPPGESVTADAVAKKVGLSRWTVARAFKNDASISIATRKTVLDAAEELGYLPDLLASALASSRSRLVALLIDDFENPHKLMMVEALTKGLQSKSWDVLLVNTPTEAHASSALLAARQRRVDAAILIGMYFAENEISSVLSASRLNKVVVFARTSESDDAISICCDDVLAMTEMTDHLLERGYRKPLYVAGPETISTKLMRQETFMSRWQDKRGVTPPSARVAKYSPNQAYEMLVGRLNDLPREELPDVIVCENDALAIGAIDAVRYGLGLRVPQDIAVSGFDDIGLGALPSYGLTTYRQPLDRMVQALLDLLDGGNADRGPIPGMLIIRTSTAQK
jgi:DNA-binding LacI/PurR family transcriptional regulator